MEAGRKSRLYFYRRDRLLWIFEPELSAGATVVEEGVEMSAKVMRIDWDGTMKRASMKAYRKEESTEVVVSHFQERKDGTMLIWLKSFGCTKWYIETREVAEILKNLNAIIPTKPRIIRDEEWTH